MILADTSAWVEHDRATGSTVHLRLRRLLADPDELAVTQPVTMEVLAGARNDRRVEDLRRLLTRARLIPFDPVADFEGAARVYRECRRNGVTPRGLLDCMVATVALRVGASVLAADADLVRIADVMALDLDPACISPGNG